MTELHPTLAGLLDDGAGLTHLSPTQWNRVLSHARVAGLLGRLYVAAADAGVLAQLPEPPMRHLESAWLLAERQREAACWEVERIHSLLYPAGIPMVLLKGAAYAFTGHPATRGRTFQDIDLLVPAGAIKEVERILSFDGWHRKQLTPHDRRYYDEWMHEIPPLRQERRGTTLDVHRAITPPIGRYPVDSQLLLDAACQVPAWDDLYVLSPQDQFLHAAAHLFLEEEFEMAYRDMVDLRLLFHAGTQTVPGFREHLEARAHTLGLEVPLNLATNALDRLFVLETPLKRKEGMLDWLFAQVLHPNHPDFRSWRRHAAEFLLYVRGHHLKLPLRLLLPHLVYKAFFATQKEKRQQRQHEDAKQELHRMIGRKV